VCALFIEDQGPPAALSLFQQASVLAREAADSWCLVCALSGVATVRNLQGDTSEARDILQQSLDIAKTAEDAEGIATAIGTLGAVALRQGDLATAEVVLAEGVNLARVLGDSRLAADSLLSLSNVALRHNDLVRARVLSEECLRLAAGVGYRSAIVSAYCQLGELARLQGDGGVARSYFTEALSVSWQVGSECPAAFLGLGRVSMDAGDVWAAEPLFNRCLAAAGSSVGNSDLAASALHELGSLSRGQGDNDRATDYHQQALRLRSQGRDPAATAESLETLGGLAIEAGAHDYGVRLLGAAQAVRRLSDNHRPPRRGGMGHDADVAAARESLTPEAFDKAWIEGEMLTVDEAVDIALAGVPETMGRPASGWESLTKSERVVSALVADNLTNREIGERLFISPRTVQTHLSHVFAKTGIADRRELARWVTRRRRRSNPLGESDYTDL
jgi:DNA-binding CsgD family transcriptional regulator/tetratricopeptide (TPR) repeat protein